MDLITSIILAGHFGLLFLLCFYGAHRLFLSVQAWRLYRPVEPKTIFEDLPIVTVQLPVYNEKFVVERLIDAVAALDYPADKLQIQVLDDSTDETRGLIAQLVAGHRDNGVWIDHIHRVDRRGYKAGALADAMPQVAGEFIAIFDADFVPEPGLLKKAIHHLADPEIGMVQTRWAHLNREYSLLTKVQAIMLDAHFVNEQVARYHSGAMFNFNGTAGIWRKQAILDGGGWQADTITEDLDLSYRVQLAGWKFAYLRDVECPSELPVDMNAFKSQQHRWAKGAIEVMKKILGTVWRAPIAVHKKVEATLHLTSNMSYMLMLVDSLLFLLPSIFIVDDGRLDIALWIELPMFAFATFSHLVFFMCGQKLLFGRVRDKLIYIPSLMAIAIGLSINNGRAVLEALFGHQSAFVRTPKLGEAAIIKTPQKQKKSGYATVISRWGDMIELMLSAVYASFMALAVLYGLWFVLPFLAIFTGGFFFAGSQSLKARRGAVFKLG